MILAPLGLVAHRSFDSDAEGRELTEAHLKGSRRGDSKSRARHRPSAAHGGMALPHREVSRYTWLMRKGLLPNVVLALALAISGQARASASSRLVYTRTTGAAHCPDEKRFRAAVAERLGYDPFFPWAEQTVTVDIFEEKGSLRAKLTLVDRNGIVRGTRALRGGARDCEEVLTSLALATSITLDPMAAQTGGPPTAGESESSTEAQRAPAPATETTLPTPDPSRTPSSAREQATRGDGGALLEVRADTPASIRWSASAGPVVAIGATPGLSMGGRLGTQLQRGHFALGVELRGALPTSQDSDAGGAVHAGVLGGAFAPCFNAGPFYACGIVYLGSMQLRGSRVETPVETSRWFAAAGARAEMAIPIGGAVDLRAHVDGMKALLPYALYLNGGEVWRSPSFWTAFGASAGVRFP